MRLESLQICSLNFLPLLSSFYMRAKMSPNMMMNDGTVLDDHKWMLLSDASLFILLNRRSLLCGLWTLAFSSSALEDSR